MDPLWLVPNVSYFIIVLYDESVLTPNSFLVASLTRIPSILHAATVLRSILMFWLDCMTRRPYESHMVLCLVLWYVFPTSEPRADADTR